MFVGFFKIIIELSLYIYNPRCDVHALPKNLVVEILYVWLQFLGGLVCFHPSKCINHILTMEYLTHYNCQNNSVTRSIPLQKDITWLNVNTRLHVYMG
jgi:hypothetical protein